MSLADYFERTPRNSYDAPRDPAEATPEGAKELPEIEDLELCVSQYNVDRAVDRHVPEWPLD